MNKQEIKKINNSLLIQLCREVGKKEQSEAKAKKCTIIINDAITKLKEV